MSQILIIEDDQQMREMVKQMLQRAGHTAIGAGDGHEGMQIVHEQAIDLIITDIIMPEQEGLETIMQVRRDYPNIPVIAISGGGRVEPENYLHSAKLLGAAHTFTKPLNRDEMLRVVMQLLVQPPGSGEA
jgi:DNA-binding NtrC family response regulator